jgi:acyl-CoA synthetase (AMP-forming)/AMP-acid ligase II
LLLFQREVILFLSFMQQIKYPLNLEGKEVIGIVAVNSIDFIKTVFQCFEHDQVAVFLRDEADTYKIQVTGATKIITPQSGFGWCNAHFIPKPSDAIAQISFTSGTTGTPKGVLLPHRALNDVVERLNAIMEVDSSIREYVGIPINYSFGFGRCRAVATAGGQFYIPENGFNPLEIRDMLLDGSINAISAVPSLWRILFECEAIFGEETKAIRWIEIGSQYMSRAEKEQLVRIFPNAKIVQHYGLTEASRSTFIRIDQTQGEHLESVGKAVGDTEIKLSGDHKIMIRGPHVAEQLLIDGQVKANVDADGWLETSDLGEIKDGYLYYRGRADDLINCGGIKVSPDDIEKSIRESLQIQSGIAVARVSDLVRGDAILVGVLTSAHLNHDAVKKAAIAAAAKNNIQSVDAIKLMEFEEFPATATGKIQRKQLAQQYEDRISTLKAAKTHSSQAFTEAEETQLTEQEKEIITAWKSVLGVDHIDVESNFFEIGGDSLTAISVMVKMGTLGIPPQIAKGMLQGLSVRELARRMGGEADDQPTSHTISNLHTKTGMNINIVRGVLVLCVVFAHWSTGFFEMLPASLAAIQPYISPVLAAGTPGFAIIYGVSAGYSMFNIFKTDRARLTSILWTTFQLLAGGILALALLELSYSALAKEIESLTDVANMFYSVLIYYLLITATLPLWFRAIVNSKNPAAKAAFLSLLLYCSYYFFFAKLGVYQTTGFLELGKLIISAKYSYINLAAGTLAGIAVGIGMRNRVEQGNTKITNTGITDGFTWIGLAFVAAGFAVCSHAGESASWLVWPLPKTFIWGWFFYLGLVLLGLSLTDRILSGYNQIQMIPKFALQSLATMGVLAFPVFVTHETVLPIKNLLGVLGLPGSISLLIALGLFAAVFTFLFRKVHSANFTW